MPSARELTAVYGNFLLSPRRGPGVCSTCFTFTDGFDRCYPCAQTNGPLDQVTPISYSVAHGQLHHALASYKRHTGEGARRLTAELAAVLWRFLEQHERCLATAAKVDVFDYITTVPSGERTRDEHHPLRRIVGEIVGPTRARHERLLTRSTKPVPARTADPEKFQPTRTLDGEPILLIDDTWTTGASAQSAAAALKHAGAGRITAVVIGRHLKRDWQQNQRRINAITRPFDWSLCAFCA